MQYFKTLSLILLISLLSMHPNAKSHTYLLTAKFQETPPKTVFIKDPSAEDVTRFFSTTTLFTLYIYRPGSLEEMDKIIKALQKDAAVKSLIKDKVTGDYHAIKLTLNATKDKAWFVALLKKAGLTTIKINNKPIIEISKI